MGRGRDGLQPEDHLWIHRAADEGLIELRADGTTWGSESALSYTRE